ncbi:T9SS type A sorting domain-containing protein, partial [candidate division KSB1 bacterium]|nr:T9SS type A sorting domain-containing protein [candidate division KSB1 bacterium]
SVKYRLRQIDTNGLSDFSEPITIFFEVPTSIKLNQNYPNPFNPTTTISYSIPNSDWVTLKVYNIKGSEVKALVNSKQKAGNHFVSFDASGLANGVYYYRLQIGEFVYTKKLIFLK